MLNLSQIESYYPENPRAFKKNILREYLQYKILEIIFASKYANQLSFLGGTALRIVYNHTRFSEDIDFDNFALTEKDFLVISKEIKNKLEMEGYEVEIKNVFKGAYRCYVRLPKVLFDNKLSGLENEKVMIQIDTAPHNFKYVPDKKILNKFDIFTRIFVTPLDILLSQKIYAVLNRKRAKGRDFFDIIFLLQKTKPDYNYLREKTGINDGKELKTKLSGCVKDFDLNGIAKDVEPFLFYPKDSEKIKMFEEYIGQFNF
ncbi:MAG: nucleotidyl transferase AbiEii/AbiGii toxin family protein [bacterium]|nr:nucleotidyl transferase AbiEii/AbiGii toxin family protein [bacterium]